LRERGRSRGRLFEDDRAALEVRASSSNKKKGETETGGESRLGRGSSAIKEDIGLKAVVRNFDYDEKVGSLILK